MMIEEIKQITEQLSSFSDQSKVWIYYSTTSFEKDSNSIKLEVENFTSTWKSHGHEVIAKGFVILNQIIILVADITVFEVSGCSMDGSVKLIKSIESNYQLNFFERENIYALIDGKIKVNTLTKINEIGLETIVFNPFFNNLGEWKSKFIQPLSESKYKRLL